MQKKRKFFFKKIEGEKTTQSDFHMISNEPKYYSISGLVGFPTG